jgi:endonuclease/exonuclease/phosphatase family metal-dependent hydrolase
MIRVVSFNFNNLLRKRFSKNAAWRSRVKNMITILKVVNPDVLLAQEIMSLSDLRFLAKRLNMKCNPKAWHPGGMCILSTDNIVLVALQTIPNSYCNALVLARTHKVWFGSIHLFSEEYNTCEDERYRETQWLLKRVKKYSEKDATILAGDWNSATISLKRCNVASQNNNNARCKRPSCEQESLPSHLLNKFRWNDAHKTIKQSTWIPSKTNNERIDRMYYKHIHLIHSEIIGPDRLSTNRWPTGRDHRLIFADFVVS